MKIGVLISGSGTNLQALLSAEREGRLAPGRIVCVVSNRADAYGLERARSAGKPGIVISHRDLPDRPAFERRLIEVLDSYGVEAVVLAGFMRVLTPTFIDRYPDRIINIHPSLLPAFPGVNGQKQAFDYGVKITGCTVHFVSSEVDGGPIILQASVPVLDDDDLERLRERILEKEHEILPKATQLLCAGRLSRQGRKVRILGA